MKAKFLPKEIDFDLSLKYFLNGIQRYESKNCHVNAYSIFYELNYNEMDFSTSKINIVTGLMAIEIKDSKYCVIHSWIEKDNRVIDVTNFANSIFKFWPNISKKDYDDIYTVSSKFKYFPYYHISNREFTKICKKLRDISEIENYIVKIIKSIENDLSFIETVKKEYGYIFKKEDFEMKLL